MLSRLPLKERAAGRWKAVLPQLGIDPKCLTGKHGPCPMCGGCDRWRFDNKDGRGTWICTHCGAGDGIALVMRARHLEFAAAALEIEQLLDGAPAETIRRERDEERKREAMNRLWRESQPVQSADPVAGYLLRRCGLTIYPRCLRYAAQCYYHDDKPTRHPAMVAMICDPDGRPTNLHRTYLTTDGRKADVAVQRRVMSGSIPRGSAIRLAPLAGELGIAEGIETALSAAALHGVPCWAAVSATMLANWTPPPEVQRVIIFGDRDDGYGGQAAAYTLAHRIAGNGRSVEVRLPTDPGDWNDVHQKSRPPAGANATGGP